MALNVFLEIFIKLCSRYDDNIMLESFDKAKIFIPLKSLLTMAIFIMMNQKGLRSSRNWGYDLIRRQETRCRPKRKILIKGLMKD